MPGARFFEETNKQTNKKLCFMVGKIIVPFGHNIPRNLQSKFQLHCLFNSQDTLVS